MSTIFTLTISSLKMFLRNKQALFFSLITPLIIMVIFGLIGFDRAAKLEVGLVAEHPGEKTTQFIESLKQIPAFNFHEASEAEERAALEKGDRSAVLVLPEGFGEQTAASPQDITLLMNAGQPQQAQTVASILEQALDKITLSRLNVPVLFTLDRQEINSRNLRYIDFLLPGVVTIAIMQMAVFSVAFVFADYKEKGILKRILATPIRPYEFVSSNVITRLLIALLQAAILIVVGVLAFHAKVVGSYPLVLLICVLGAVMFLGLGFTISGLASTVEAVPALANLAVFPMLFLGGAFFPITSMPGWLQHAAKVLPLTHFSTSLRGVMLENASFTTILPDLLWMLGWAVIFIFLANLTFAFEEKRV